MTSQHEVALQRVVAQQLAQPRARTAPEAVDALVALQAQDLESGLASVALRVARGTRSTAVRALDDGDVVRSWPLRGTLHLVLATDLPWLIRLLSSRSIAAARTRARGLGIDDALISRATDTAIGALTGTRGLVREDLYRHWNEAGVDTDAQRGYHLLWHLAQRGVVCLGPLDGGRQQRIVLLDEWITHPRALEDDEALAELAARYFRGHGPATVRDLARWAGLTQTVARAATELAAPTLGRTAIDGTEHLHDPQIAELLAARRSAARGVLLLPGFDELILGYEDRSATVPASAAPRIAPGSNGMFLPTIVSDGQVVGTWRRSRRGSPAAIETTMLAGVPPALAGAIARAAANRQADVAVPAVR
jgi:hypothetical protein